MSFVIIAELRIAGLGNDLKCRTDLGAMDLEARVSTGMASREAFIVL